ncbi:MAG TPA: glyoxalase superfamily protein [Opitutaceae bacterium]|nr:glyoxalase superfamily protein [Opitutaceae bacterium]
MSPIDALKSEAVTLRQKEKDLGRALKHSDALELVAKKHGYANWRACCAILTDVLPTLTDPPREQTPQRLAESEQPPTVVPFDPEQFDKYVGFYQVNPSLFFSITREGDRFFTQLTGQPKVEIYRESPTKFLAKFAAAEIIFVTNSEGTTTELILHQNGMERHGLKVDESVVKAGEAALAERIKSNTSDPDREAPLRRNIDGLIKGQPALDDMAPGLIAATNKQWPAIQKDFQRAGALKSLVFEKVDERGWDAYIATFENKEIKFLIGPLNADRKIQGLLMFPAPDASLAERIKNNTPDPDREAPLRRNIDGLIKGQPVLDEMAPGLIAATNKQWPGIQKQFQGSGALKSLVFKKVDDRGRDVYIAAFENGEIEFLIGPLDSNRKIQWLLMRPAS